jgi:hypothetical protein
MNLRPQDLADAQATAQADPDRERLARVRYTLCGCEVSYLVQGPIRVELDDQVIEVHVTRDGLVIGDGPGAATLASAIHSAARAGTVAERERQIRALVGR